MPGQSDLPKQLWIDLSQAEEQHLSYEQIEAFVDSRLDAIEAELVRAHADLCDQCAAELNDLAEFAKSLKSKVLTIPDRVTIWDRIASWFKIPRNLWATAGIATALMVVLTMRQSMFIHGNAPGSTAAGESAQTQPNVPTTPSMPESASSQGNPSTTTSTKESASAQGSAPATATNGDKHPVEAVLDASSGEEALASSKDGIRPNYRVLSSKEAAAYYTEIAFAPNDPVARAAIDIKYSLFGEAEKEYRRLEARGGADAEKARQLLQQLDKLRGR